MRLYSASLAMALLLASHAGAQIVNNSATAETSEDSVTVTVLALDSLGNPSAADSFYIAVFSGGSANTPVFADSGDVSLTGLDTATLGGATCYYFSRKASDIDGDGAPGVYSGVILARNTSLNLSQPEPLLSLRPRAGRYR